MDDKLLTNEFIDQLFKIEGRYSSQLDKIVGKGRVDVSNSAVSLKNASDKGDVKSFQAEITVSGVIDQFVYNELSGALKNMRDKSVLLNISSNGGSVFSGVAVYNLLRSFTGNVAAHVHGMAASIASVILQGADERMMAEGSQVMIHDAWGLAIGNAEEMEKAASLFNKMSNIIAGIYSIKGEKNKTEFRDLMKAETFLSGAEAKDLGLVDEYDVASMSSSTPPDSSALSNDTSQAQALITKILAQ